jgi:2-oxoglutarate ferredoxin oxidoreductase subunit gamma
MRAFEIIMAGFGGQGILMTGKLLASAAMDMGKEVSWLPSYGPEMRGGTCNVTVCISDTPIGSPYVTKPNVLMVMNQPSLEKFGPDVEPGGIIVVDSTLIPITIDRDDCRVIYVEATRIADQSGTRRAANIVMLGVLLGNVQIVSKESAAAVVKEAFARKPKFIPINLTALEAGYEIGLERREG